MLRGKILHKIMDFFPKMDPDDRKTPIRRLPYREEKRFHEMARIRPVKENDVLKVFL